MQADNLTAAEAKVRGSQALSLLFCLENSFNWE